MKALICWNFNFLQYKASIFSKRLKANTWFSCFPYTRYWWREWYSISSPLPSEIHFLLHFIDTVTLATIVFIFAIVVVAVVVVFVMVLPGIRKINFQILSIIQALRTKTFSTKLKALRVQRRETVTSLMGDEDEYNGSGFSLKWSSPNISVNECSRWGLMGLICFHEEESESIKEDGDEFSCIVLSNMCLRLLPQLQYPFTLNCEMILYPRRPHKRPTVKEKRSEGEKGESFCAISYVNVRSQYISDICTLAILIHLF